MMTMSRHLFGEVRVMHASDFLYDFHTIFEGVRHEAYQDSVGIWTIGIGHTGPDVEPESQWDDDQIRDAWESDIVEAESLANDWLEGAQVSQELFDALVDIAFNTGKKPKTMVKYALSGNENAAIDELLRWVYAGGKVLLGLVKRRMAMYVYCHGGDWEAVANCPLNSTHLERFNRLIEQYGYEVLPDEDTNFAVYKE